MIKEDSNNQELYLECVESKNMSKNSLRDSTSRMVASMKAYLSPQKLVLNLLL
jgi:hypothetical protein